MLKQLNTLSGFPLLYNERGSLPRGFSTPPRRKYAKSPPHCFFDNALFIILQRFNISKQYKIMTKNHLYFCNNTAHLAAMYFSLLKLLIASTSYN